MPKCTNCQSVVSFDAPWCASCGARDPGKGGPSLLAGLLLLAGLIGSVVIFLLPAILASWTLLPGGHGPFVEASGHAWAWIASATFWAALAGAWALRRRRGG